MTAGSDRSSLAGGDDVPRPMIGFLRRLRGLFGVSYASMLAYRAELILWLLSNSLSFILMGVWMEATKRGQFALTPIDVVRYFLVVFIVRQLTMVWVIWDIEQQMQNGQLAARLLQPLDPFWRHIMGHVAERVARLPFTVVLVFLFFLLYPAARFAPSVLQIAGFLLFTALAFLMRFMMQYTVSMACFWTEKASSIEQVLFMFYMFASGAIIPLSVLPPAVQNAIAFTPFPYLLWMPCQVLLGGVDGAQTLRGIGIIILWILFFVVVNRLAWRAGLKRFSSMGA